MGNGCLNYSWVSSVVRGICVPGVARQSGAGVIRLVHGAVNAHSLDAFFGRCAWRAQGIVGVPTVASTILLNDGSSIWPVARVARASREVWP